MSTDLDDQVVAYGRWLERQCATQLHRPVGGALEQRIDNRVDRVNAEMGSAGPSEPSPRHGRLLAAAAVVLVVAGVLGLVAVTRSTPTPSVPLNDSVGINDPEGALFVLPNPIDAYQLANGSWSTSRQDANAPVETFAPNGVLLGVADGSGYTRLRSVSIYGTSPVDATWEQVDTPTGPAFVSSEPGVAVAQQRGDQWLLVTTQTDEQQALDMLDVVTIDDAGGIVVDAKAAGLVVIDDYPPQTGYGAFGTYFETTTPDGAPVTVETATSPTPLFPAASVADRIEPTEIDGARAWTATRADSDGEWNGLVWSATPNRIVAVSGQTTPAEIRRLAESLQVVEQATWQQALPSATKD